MTFNQLCALADALNELTGRNFRVCSENGVVALHDEQLCQYSPWMTHKELGRWMDAFRRGYHVCEASVQLP